jgi:flagellar FliJ protein
MARLEPLIKLRKQQVDDKQRLLAELYRQQDILQKQRDQVVMEMSREQALIEADPTNLEARKFFGAYREGVQRKLAALEVAEKKLETRVVIIRDEVRNAFAELKKIEITDRERKKQVRDQAEAKESNELDDIALEIFRRGEE